jgi:hypothetical protein
VRRGYYRFHHASLYVLPGALDKRYVGVLMLNLSNELIFTCANHGSAVIASKKYRRTRGCRKNLRVRHRQGVLHVLREDQATLRAI